MKISLSLIGITLILCILKVLNIITISWLWCLAPIWIPLAILFNFILMLLLVLVIYIFIPIIFDVL